MRFTRRRGRAAMLMLWWLCILSRPLVAAWESGGTRPDAPAQARNLLREAFELSKTIPNATARIETLGMIYAEQLRLSDREGAARTLQDASLLARDNEHSSVTKRYDRMRMAEQLGRGNCDALVDQVKSLDPWLKSTQATHFAEWCMSLGDRKTALKLLDFAVGAADAVTMYGIKAEIPDADHANKYDLLRRISLLQWRAGDQDGAVRTVDSIPSDGLFGSRLKVLPYCRFAADLGQSGDRRRAGELLSRATESLESSKGRNPRERANYMENLLPRIIAAQASLGQLDDALRTVGRLELDSSRAEALGSVARIRAEMGDFPGALRVAGTMDACFAKASALTAISDAQFKAGDRDEATVTLKSAMESADAIRGTERSVALCEIAVVQAKFGRTADALRTAGTIEAAYEKADAFCRIASFQMERNDQEGALRTLEQATEISQTILSNSRQVVILRNAAVEQARAGDKSASRRTFQRAIEVADTIKDLSNKAQSLQQIMQGQMRANDGNAADATLKRIIKTAMAIAPDPKYPIPEARTLAVIRQAARARAEMDESDPSLEWVAGLSSPLQKCWALQGAAWGMMKRTDEQVVTSP